MGALDLDYGGKGAAAFDFYGRKLALEVLVGDEVFAAAAVFGLHDETSSRDDLPAVHHDAVDDVAAALREDDFIQTVVDDDLRGSVALYQGRFRRRLFPGCGTDGLVVGADRVEFEGACLAGAESGVEAHPFDAAVVPS